MKKRYCVRCAQSGIWIERTETLEEAENILTRCILQDGMDMCYEDGFYEIYDMVEHKTIIRL
jgi:hypothetical protein